MVGRAARRTLWAVLAAAVVWAATGLSIGTAEARSSPPRVTVIGDSVQASFAFAPAAVRHLGRGVDLRMEARACRRLSAPGCLGGSPPSAVAVADSLGPALGDVVVVHVGYNDWITAYGADAAMAAFRRAGVRAVVWVLLREASPNYRPINARIREVARRAAVRGDQPIVRIADWNSHGAGRSGWFTADRVHLNGAGAVGLATLLREEVLSVLAELGTSIDGRPVATRIDTHRLPARAGSIASSADTLWFTAGGRVHGRDDHNGGPVPRPQRLAAGERLVGDGTTAWLAGQQTLTRLVASASGRRGRSVAVRTTAGGVVATRHGSRTWALERCPPDGGSDCPGGWRLRGSFVGGRPADRVSALGAGVATALAMDATALWVAKAGPGGGTRLEQRDPVRGRVLRVIRLGQPVTSLALGPRGVWVSTPRGDLLRVTPKGRVGRVQRAVSSVAATGDQLWTIGRDRRTIANLHPVSGRVRGRARSKEHLSGRLMFTERHVWALSRSGMSVVRLSRVR